MSPTPVADGTDGTSRDYLTVALGEDVFALPVDCVREVLDPPAGTLVPNAPDHVSRLVNVRGNVVPLVDLRRRFDLAERPDDAATRLVVAEIHAGGESFLAGLKADAVFEVMPVPRDAVEALPRLGCRWPEAYTAGIVRNGQDFVILLDLPGLLGLGRAAA